MNTDDKIVDDLDDIFEEIASEMDAGYLDKAAELEAIAISGGDKNLWQSEYLVIRARKIQKERKAAKLKQEENEKQSLLAQKALRKKEIEDANTRELKKGMLIIVSVIVGLYIVAFFYNLIF